MDIHTKKAIALVLADLYEIKCLLKNKPPDKAYLYGLRNGFESAIPEEITDDWWISFEDEKNVAEVLTPYFEDEDKLKKLRGYYDLEPQFTDRGIERLKARAILKYFHSKNSFPNIISKLDTSDSPQECRTFEISEFDI